MAELRLTKGAAVDSAQTVATAADKIESVAKEQVSNVANAAVMARSAAREAKAEKEDAKEAAQTTVHAVEKLSGDVNQLKEFVNGYLTQRLQEASKSGYAMGVSDQIGKTVEDHDKRIGNVETKLGEVDSRVGTILDIVRGNGDRSTVRGESIK